MRRIYLYVHGMRQESLKKHLTHNKCQRQTVVISNIVDVHWQKAGVSSHIEENVFETKLLNTEELRNATYNVFRIVSSWAQIRTWNLTYMKHQC